MKGLQDRGCGWTAGDGNIYKGKIHFRRGVGAMEEGGSDN
jgi:hypothetical protein